VCCECDVFLLLWCAVTNPISCLRKERYIDIQIYIHRENKGALQLLINHYGYIRSAQVPERVLTKGYVILIIGNSKLHHLGVQGIFNAASQPFRGWTSLFLYLLSGQIATRKIGHTHNDTTRTTPQTNNHKNEPPTPHSTTLTEYSLYIIRL